MVIRIFFRYLFGRLFAPFAVCLSACALIWIMADLYGNLDDFLEHKINMLLILRFYIQLIPSIALRKIRNQATGIPGRAHLYVAAATCAFKSISVHSSMARTTAALSP